MGMTIVDPMETTGVEQGVTKDDDDDSHEDDRMLAGTTCICIRNAHTITLKHSQHHRSGDRTMQ